ncbi:MAG: hypothetical protein NWE95_11760 [Candidatus Bathyarchaeota archaeon]|nr:hypothetical protein [Candidatus Bathyarchaeota archaeon]
MNKRTSMSHGTNVAKLVNGCEKCGNRIALFECFAIPKNPELHPIAIWKCVRCGSRIEMHAKNSSDLHSYVETYISEPLPEKEIPGADYGALFDMIAEGSSRPEALELRRIMYKKACKEALTKEEAGKLERLRRSR